MTYRIDFSHERDLTLTDLERRISAYYPDADLELLRKAYRYAEEKHKGQKRSSGESYFIHPINVAATLIKLRMDLDSIIAGLLHDVIEDCEVCENDIESMFSKSISGIVIGLTKISKIKFKNREESQAENFRKMIVAMAQDIRVIIVKLADRMHNMRTLQYVSDEKQKTIAQETLDIYVPLASRLGINSVKGDLEDLCLRFLKPEIYYRLAEKVAMKRDERDEYIHSTVEIIKEKLSEYSLQAEVKGRPKHFYSIYKKMIARGVDFDQIQDILAFRLIVSNITECYKSLGIIHSSFTPVPGRFKDYIAIPKVNGYQSLHTTVIGPRAERIEIQIRTTEMDEIAETGVAAHWKYKEGISDSNTKLDWVQELLEFNQNVDSNSEFMHVIKNDLDIGGVFVFTPKGEVVELRHGATPLDFAYAVHTEVGHRCVGSKVNGKIVPLRYRLKSGDSVEVLTSRSQSPSKDWLNIVKTSRAKTKIKQWLLKVERDKNRDVGKELFEKSLRLLSVSMKNLKKSGDFANILKKINAVNEDELYVMIGSGRYTTKNIVDMIPNIKNLEEKDNKELLEEKINEIDSLSQQITKTVKKKVGRDNAIIVDGMSDVIVRMAKCCSPIPGDNIVGYITRGRGITVHTSACERMSTSSEIGRYVSVSWNESFAFKHPVNIKVIAHDKPGVLSLITQMLNKLSINIRTAIAKSLPDRKGSFLFEIEVHDYSELLKIIGNIESLEEVISVSRG